MPMKQTKVIRDLLMKRALTFEGWFTANELHPLASPTSVQAFLKAMIDEGEMESRETDLLVKEYRWIN